MSEVVKGTIEKVENKVVNDSKLNIYTIGGTRYSHWSDESFEEGDYVMITYVVNDKYKNIKTITKGTPVVEEVKDTKVVATTSDYQKGAAFGLSCNQALEMTLKFFAGNEPDFEETYKKRVRTFFKWNEELKAELVK